MSVLVSLLMTFRDGARSRAALQLEILALRHQLHVLERSQARRLRLTRVDRLLWIWFSRVWCHWRSTLVIVKPETVVAWHRRGFRLFWTWKSRHRTGRPTVARQVRALIGTMSAANPLSRVEATGGGPQPQSIQRVQCFRQAQRPCRGCSRLYFVSSDISCANSTLSSPLLTVKPPL
jgi:hypothetical protein